MEGRRMPTLSLYQFSDGVSGPFDGLNVKIPTGRSVTFSSHEQPKVLEVWVRDDTETVIDMAQVLANSVVTNTVTKLLTGGTTLASPLLAEGMNWGRVPDKLRQAVGNRVSPGDATVRVFFDVHVPAQSGCLAVTPTLAYYIVFRIGPGMVMQGTVEGFWHQIPGWMG